MSDTETVAKKILTPEFRVSFPFVFKPRVNKNNPGADPKYSITMLFRIQADPVKAPNEKVVDIRPLVAMAQNAAIETWGEKSKWPKNLMLPFKKGEDKVGIDGYGPGIIAVNATSKQAPTVWNEMKQDIIDPKEFQPGFYAVATLGVFTWENTGKKGVSFGLRNIMKLRNGKILGGGGNPDEDFSSIPLPTGGKIGAMDGTGGIEDLGIL